MRKKKVAIIYRMDQHGGVQSCVFSLIKGLNKIGIIPDILWDLEPNWKELKNSGLNAGYKKLRLLVPSLIIEKLPYSLRYLAYILCYMDGDVICRDYDFIYSFYNGIIFNEKSHIYYLSGPPLIKKLVQAKKDLKHIPFKLFQLLYNKLLYRINPVYEYHQNSRYVINSNFTSSLFFEEHGVNLPVVHPPINLPDNNFIISDLKYRDTITYFSRIVDYKRPELVIELAKKYPQYRFVIMGGLSSNRKVYFKSLQKLAENYGNIIFIPNASYSIVKSELSRTRYYVFPAKNEHFGMTTPEAIGFGAVPFVHDSGGQIEIVIDDRLRFNDNNFFEKFALLAKMTDIELNIIRLNLLDHIKKYSEDNYIQHLLAYIK